MKKITFIDMMENAFYSNVDPRRRQEVKDSRMISEDNRAMANLSEQATYRQFDPDSFKYDQNSAARPRFIFNDEIKG